MWSYDSVETLKCHAEYKESTTHGRREVYSNNKRAIPKLIRWEVYSMCHVQVS